MQPASFYKTREHYSIQCQLCPHQCILDPGQYGKCNTRVNRNGKLITESYGVLSAISTDPIEKKPLYHFYPGRSILSIGSYGCNLSCDFCQNCDISQINSHILSHRPYRDPEDIVNKAILHQDNIGLAFTYNEPTVYFEYMIRCAALIKEHRRCNVMVTNGYINEAPLEAILPYMDAFNVDLKSFRNEFYHKYSSASLKPVLETIARISKSDRHMELTFLIIPGLNDSIHEWTDMINWITENCGTDVVLHVSRYFPRYKRNNPPTPFQTIQNFIELARDKMKFVYAGNTPQLESHTICPACGTILIQRSLYHAIVTGIGMDGHCKQCNLKIYGIFNENIS